MIIHVILFLLSPRLILDYPYLQLIIMSACIFGPINGYCTSIHACPRHYEDLLRTIISAQCAQAGHTKNMMSVQQRRLDRLVGDGHQTIVQSPFHVCIDEPCT